MSLQVQKVDRAPRQRQPLRGESGTFNAKASLHIALCFCALVFLGSPARGQSNVIAPAQYLPQYFVGSGVTYDYYGGTGFAATTDLAIRLGNTSGYSYNSLDLTATQATLRAGACYVAAVSGNWLLAGCGQAGVATGSSATLASFTGGGFLGYDIGALVTKGADHFYILFTGDLLATSSTSTTSLKPIFGIRFGKGF